MPARRRDLEQERHSCLLCLLCDLLMRGDGNLQMCGVVCVCVCVFQTAHPPRERERWYPKTEAVWSCSRQVWLGKGLLRFFDILGFLFLWELLWDPCYLGWKLGCLPRWSYYLET